MAIDRIRTGVICQRETPGGGRQVLAIELEDPATRKRFWSFPGGGVEEGETPAEAAVRETLEETGHAVRLTSDVFINEYLFYWNAARYQCTTHWYTAELTDTAPVPVSDADYLIGHAWLAWPRSRVLFANSPAITPAVEYFLD